MKEYIIEMLNDKELDNDSKLKLLISFKEKVKFKMLNTISHSSELFGMNDVLKFINLKLKEFRE